MNLFCVLKKIIGEHGSYWQQLRKLAKADLSRTYRGSSLGWGWAIIKPSFTIFIYWFAFSAGLRNASNVEGMPFFFWLLAGILPWFYMSDMLYSGTRSIKKYSYLVTKMKFPISTISTVVSMSNFIVHIGLTIITIFLFWIGGYPPDIYLLQLPFYALCLFLFFTVLSLLTAILAVISVDFANFIRSIVVAIFWLSGVILNVSHATGALKLFYKINPVTYLSYGYRNVFVKKIWFFQQPEELLFFSVILFLVFILSLVTYQKFRQEIPDVL